LQVSCNIADISDDVKYCPHPFTLLLIVNTESRKDSFENLLYSPV